MNPQSYKWLPLPPDFSVHGPQVERLIFIVHILMFALFIGWGIYFVYCLFRYRARAGHKAVYEPAKGKVAKSAEIGVILAEAVLLVGLSMPVWANWKHDFPNAQQALRVKVIGEQFAWNFHYPGKDGIFGRTDPKLMNNTGNSLGLDPADPNGKDDIITLNEFHIPVNRPIIVDISSKDVIHSFTINVLRVKQDAVPGMVIPIHFEANHTGQFDLGCAQLCGLGHYRMRGMVSIDSSDQFAKWVNDKESERQGATQ